MSKEIIPESKWDKEIIPMNTPDQFYFHQFGTLRATIETTNPN